MPITHGSVKVATTVQPGAEAAEEARQRRRVILSGFVGSSIEYYDFLLYSSAASLVFTKVFFSNTSGAVGLLLSFSTLAIGYLIRPIGGIIFGHFGDRLGRKRMLIITMSLMGAATFLVGLIPGYSSIGEAAPVILIVLRLIQGIAVGGDWGGSSSISVEVAREGQRGRLAAFTNMGAPCGATVSAAVLALFGLLNPASFMAWGWRVPFLLAGPLVLVGLVIRLRMSESQVFKAAQKAAEDRRKQEAAPIVTVLRTRWRGVLVGSLGTMSCFVFEGLMGSYALTLATTEGHHSTGEALLAFSVLSAVQIVAVGYCGHLSDRVGRRKFLLIGLSIGLVCGYPSLWLVAQPSLALFYLGMFIGMMALAAVFGPSAAFISEMFTTRTRYTGSSLGYQIGSTLGNGIAPLAAASLAAIGGFGYVALYLIACHVLGLIVVGLARNTAPSEDAAAPEIAAAEAV